MDGGARDERRRVCVDPVGAGRVRSQRAPTTAPAKLTREDFRCPEELDQGGDRLGAGSAQGRAEPHRDRGGRSVMNVLATIGVKRDELATKLRQPLGELVGDRKLHTVGEKRLMKYHVGAKK